MITCPKCGTQIKDAGQAAKGSVRRPTKGFGTPAVLRRALRTRRANAKMRREGR
jgi:hypothetical protein